MLTVTSLDIPDAKAIAGDLDQAADRLSAAIATLKQVLTANDGCWGSDEFGENFAKSYLPQADEALESSEMSASTLGDIADNLRLIVDAFRDLDQEGGGVLNLSAK